MKYSTPCTPQVPCGLHRHCDHCARLRQHRIAELAASRCRSEQPTYAVITGLSPLSAVVARRFRAGQGGIWTIEAGSKMGGLHANLILDADQPVTADEIAAQLGLANYAVWSQAIPRRDLRNVAAYISKRSGMPLRIDYDGRLYGSWGTWRGAAQVAREQRIAPAVAGAAHQTQLQQLGILNTTQAQGLRNELNSAAGLDLSPTDYKAIAARYLAGIRQIVDK